MSTLVEFLPTASAVYQAYRDEIGRLEAIVAAGRDPTPEEWARLESVTDDLHAQIQAL